MIEKGLKFNSKLLSKRVTFIISYLINWHKYLPSFGPQNVICNLLSTVFELHVTTNCKYNPHHTLNYALIVS